MNPTLQKILIATGSILVACLICFQLYKQNEMSKKQDAIEMQIVKQKELVDGIVRSQSSYVSKSDIESFIKENNINLKAIQEDMKKLHADLVAANSVVVSSKGYTGTNIASTSSGPKNTTLADPKNPDPYETMKEQKNLKLNEEFASIKVPIGQVGFSAWQKEPWSLDLYPRKYKISTILAMDEKQRQFAYNKFILSVDNKDYEIPIEQAEIKQVYPEAKFSLWNPRLFIGANAGVNLSKMQPTLGPSLAIGLMSYGKFVNQPDFSILQFGVGYDAIDKVPQIDFAPASYNIGQHLPFMNNLYLTPSLTFSLDKSIGAMIGVRAAL